MALLVMTLPPGAGRAPRLAFFLLIALLLPAQLLLAARARAQAVSAELSGTVRDAETGAPLARANVVLVGTGTGAATDAEGRYALPPVAPGAYVVAVSYLGYEPFREEVALRAGEERRLEVALAPRGVSIGEVVVTAAAEEEAQDLSVARLTAAEIKGLPTVLEPDVFRALQLLPGIQAVSDFSSGLYIRGGSPDQTLILLDAAPLYNPSHVFGFFSTFNPDAVGDVLVYKGAYPAEYGGRLGSVVALSTRRGAEEVSARVGVGLLASRASVSGPHPRGRWLVAVRRSTIEPLLAALNSADVEGVPESFSFYDVNARADLDLGAAGRLSLAGYAGRDRLLYPFRDVARFDVSYGNQALSARWTRPLAERLTAGLAAAASPYVSDPRAAFGGTGFRQATTLRDVTLRGTLGWDAAPAHAVEAGFKAGRFAFDLRRTFDGETRFRPSLRTGYVAAYVEDAYRPAERWTITAGLRASYYSNGRFARLSPRLSAEYRPTDALRLQAAYGRYRQHLSLVSSPFFSAFDVWLTTSDGVPPAYGDQFVAGLRAQLPGAFRLDVETYYRTMRALFEVDPLRTDVVGLDYADVFRFGEGYATGVEMLARRTEGRLNGFLSYAYSKTARRFRGFKNFQYYPPKHDRRHSLSLALNVDLSDTWRLTGVFRYGSGQAYTQPNAYFRLDSPFGNTNVTTLISDYNGARLPPYHRLDLGVRRQGRFLGIGRYELLLQVVNAYGRRNTWFYLFDTDADGSVGRTAVPQIPVPLPNVAFTVEF